jgi:phosphatidate cytidylyltransferase
VIVTRIISALIGIIALIFIINSSAIIISISVTLVSIIALNELFTAMNKKMDIRLPGWWAYISAVVICFRSYLNDVYILAYIFISILVLFIIMLSKYNKIKLFHIALMFFSLTYICFFLSHTISILNLEYGHVYVWLIFIGAWSTDTFAFAVGSLMGKHKLCARISPKKTIEGSIGGIVGCIVSFIIYGYLIYFFKGYHINYISLSILGMLCSIISQIGDLSASVIKRQLDIKDFGEIMPGHGGVLDRFDSVIFAAPLVYYFLALFSLIK